jgi:large subunit ribosomal protein L23
MSKTLVLKPRLSEKTYGLSQLNNVYVFVVPNDATKLTIAEAVTAQFDVTVLAVNTINLKGKMKRTVKKGGRQIHGQRSDTKRAYVTVKPGDHIPVFAAVEEAEAESAKAEAKAEKKAAKTAKETK